MFDNGIRSQILTQSESRWRHFAFSTLSIVTY